MALFQRQHVDATLLNSGETGKILKTLNEILPLENKHRDVGLESNIVEVIADIPPALKIISLISLRDFFSSFVSAQTHHAHD